MTKEDFAIKLEKLIRNEFPDASVNRIEDETATLGVDLGDDLFFVEVQEG